MVYDLKAYKKLINTAVEPQGTNVSRTAPFLVVKNDSEYLFSTLRAIPNDKESSNYRSYDFCFRYEDLLIEEANVWKIEFCTRCSEGKYNRVFLDAGVIFSAEDMADFMMVFYHRRNKDSLHLSYDISLYDNNGLFCKLNDVKSLSNNRVIDKNHIFYYRQFNNDYSWYGYDERWVYMNGEEHSENQLNLSLSEWNELFQPHSNSYWNISVLYSPENKLPFTSKELRWNSELSCKWRCALGHTWVIPVKEVTQGRSYCPVCNEHVANFRYNTEQNKAQRIYSQIKTAQDIFKSSDLEFIKTLLNEEIAELQEMKSMGISWFDHGKMPDTITFYFAYPNGKHGDIDKVLCESIGEVTKLDEYTYKAVLPTDYYEKIELLSESYADMTLLKDLANDELNTFLPRHNVMHRLHFLSSLAHSLNMSSQAIFALDREMTQYRIPLREKRTQIYNEIVGENKASRRWISEQLLYHIIKSIYPDAIFQYKTEWLGHQSLDIYIPSQNLGVEYQGKQHYEVVELFGGEKEFNERRILDERKRELCRLNGVNLLEWKYTTEITEENVRLFLESI